MRIPTGLTGWRAVTWIRRGLLPRVCRAGTARGLCKAASALAVALIVTAHFITSPYIVRHVGNCDVLGYRPIISIEECVDATRWTVLPRLRGTAEIDVWANDSVTVRQLGIWGASQRPSGCYYKLQHGEDDLISHADHVGGLYFNPKGNPRSSDPDRISLCAATTSNEHLAEPSCTRMTKPELAKQLMADSSQHTRQITPDGAPGPSIYCYVIMFPGGTEPFLVRNSLILGSLSGCDAFEIFSNTTDIPGFRAHPTTCQDNSDFVDALNYNCTAWLDYSCSSQENTSAYTAHEVRDVRRNCPVTCGTCGQGTGNYGAPWPTVIKAINGSMDAPRGGKSRTAMNTEIFIKIYKTMFELGTFRQHDLVVKLDSDTVFSANRLRGLFENEDVSSPRLWSNSRWEMGDLMEGHPVRTPIATHGPMIVMTAAALDRYRKAPEECHNGTKLNKSIYSHWGEDWFLTKCLTDVLGAKADFMDKQLLETQRYWAPHDQHCFHEGVVAFHPYKTTASFYECWMQMRITDITVERDSAGACDADPHGSVRLNIVT